MSARITLRELTKDNWEGVIKLKVRDDQTGFVAPNVYTIAETRFHPWSRCRVMYAGHRMIGFAAYGVDPDDKQLWLHRFMIDADHQGQGYGRASLKALIAEWEADYPEAPVVYLSYTPANAAAEHLYTSQGWIPGEIANWGERIAVRQMRSPHQ